MKKLEEDIVEKNSKFSELNEENLKLNQQQNILKQENEFLKVNFFDSKLFFENLNFFVE